jgi:predicted nucleic acid-binding protein
MTASTRAVVDTNVLLYAFDTAEPQKHPIAQALLKQLILDNHLVLSAQNLNEFYNIATRPNRKSRMSHDDTVKILHDLAAVCEVAAVTQDVSFRALDAVAHYQMSVWDALVWAAAKESGATTIYTEDIQSTPEIEGVRYVNPFAAS